MANQQDGFVVFYNQFKNKIYNYFLYRIGFDQKLAEDLTSEVFLKALKNFVDFDDDRPFGPWIFAIAHNHLVNYYKLAGRETSLTDKENFLPANKDGVVERLELEQIIKLMDLLEPAEKEILLLRFVSGLTNTEIADALKKEEGAIRTRISRALTKLRDLLAKQYER